MKLSPATIYIPNQIIVLLHFLISEEFYSALIAGGWHNGELDTVEIIPKHDDCIIPKLPAITTHHPSLIKTTNDEIIICGGRNNWNKCLSLDSDGWSEHSLLTKERRFATAIGMPNGIYLFGGYDTRKNWEWLPAGSTLWQNGGDDIPDPGFHEGCGASISDTELILIGGHGLEIRSCSTAGSNFFIFRVTRFIN